MTSPTASGPLRRSSQLVRRRLQAAFSVHGWAFQRLAVSYALNVAGDTLVALALADTLFFSVPTAEARGNVVAYLLVTLAPFAIIGPVLGAVFGRYPATYRFGLIATALARTIAAIVMIGAGDDLALLALAFTMLVLSRIYGISRSSILPRAIPQAVALVDANARLARFGILAGALVVPLGAAAGQIGRGLVLVLAAVAFLWSAAAAMGLRLELATATTSEPTAAEGVEPANWRQPSSGRAVRYARIATAIVRLLNGYLLLLVAFAFRDGGEGVLSFGLLLGAAGGGYALASYLAPVLERRLREEPMVVAALALEAAAAFIAAQFFGIPAAAALALFAGLAWGMAKFGYDGLLQSSIPESERGRLFTRSETLFQLAWVIGAVIPVAASFPIDVGLVIAGCAALLAQVVIVSALLVSVREA